MVCFDDESTTMHVRAPFLECVDDGEQLPFMHRIILSALESFLDAKATVWDPFSPSCSNTAPIPMSLASHVTMYDFEESANCNTGVLLTASLRF
jgi:hypothetical protein